ncbi:mandelate racemase/muconate lactonizing enzyme family protein [Halomicrobium salinisoli]|uniref:mandelate racemase/muconate lactonizing enzyme family protein n=1 Tax=Halomicrobium salinisoli TaxID=2878391 RepID=UPI001CF035EF|nr:enolase C-terminal domain-like protein [Halomicrobium salinisoli]
MIEEFSLPLAEPLSTADGAIERRDGFLVEVSHRGTAGIGESTPLPGWTESVEECRTALDAALETGSDEGDYRAALRSLAGEGVPAARHGLSTALLDADARAEGVPLARWLGGDRPASSVPVNATVGDADRETTVERAETAVDRGFDCLKLKVGARPVEADVERVAAVRRAVGEDVTLRVDANGAWGPDDAANAMDALAEFDLQYVEQPLAASDLDGHADLPDEPAVALDEALVEHPVADVLDADAADYLVLKPMALGGPGDAHAIAERAREAGVEPVISTTVDGVVARTAAVHVAAAVPDVEPCGLATADLLAADLGPDPAPVEDGRVRVPDGPGLGIDPAEVSP